MQMLFNAKKNITVFDFIKYPLLLALTIEKMNHIALYFISLFIIIATSA